MKLKIFVGADHRGVTLKKKIVDGLARLGHDPVDVGTFDEGKACDYPAIAFEVAENVSRNPESRGILVCMSGIGHSIAANKVPGVYAALCYNEEAAVLSRQHNNANVLVLGAKFVPDDRIFSLVKTWLETDFEGGRHERRVAQIKSMEEKLYKKTK